MLIEQEITGPFNKEKMQNSLDKLRESAVAFDKKLEKFGRLANRKEKQHAPAVTK